MKYRKLPVVIDAIQFDGRNTLDVIEWVGETHDLSVTVRPGEFDRISIPTLEGDVAASPGDYIIRGVRGEIYPCKPEIFAQTYEPVE